VRLALLGRQPFWPTTLSAYLARPHQADTQPPHRPPKQTPKGTNSKEARIMDRYIHPTDWHSYVRYARNAKTPDWRPPLVNLALTKFDKAVDALTPRQFGLFVLFVFGYAASALLDPQQGCQSRRAFPDDPATWRRRVGHKVTRDDLQAWKDAGLIEFTDAEGTLIDASPNGDESPELKREPEREARRERDRGDGREQEPEGERGQEPERDHEEEREAEPGPERGRADRKARFLTDHSKRSSERAVESQDVTCSDCGQVHGDLPGHPPAEQACKLNARLEGHSLEEINTYRRAAGKTPWV
jgi:hypothetical protein